MRRTFRQIVLAFLSCVFFTGFSFGTPPTIEEVVKNTKISSAKFSDTPVWECLKLITSKNNLTGDYGAINVVFFGDERDAEKKISLDLQNVSVATALDDICKKSGFYYELEEFAVFVGRNIPNLKALNPNFTETPQPRIKRLKELILPRVLIDNATLAEYVEFLKIKAKFHDGFEIRMEFDQSLPVKRRVFMSLSNIPFFKLVEYFALIGNLDYRFDGDQIVLSEKPKK